MPDNTSYQDYHQSLTHKLAEYINTTAPFNGGDLDELQVTFKEKLSQILAPDSSPEEQMEAGQWLLTQIVGNYQHIMPSVPRPLFWYFGGECMHYLGDEEIEHFQKLEETYHELLLSKKEAAIYEQVVLSFEQSTKPQRH